MVMVNGWPDVCRLSSVVSLVRKRRREVLDGLDWTCSFFSFSKQAEPKHVNIIFHSYLRPFHRGIPTHPCPPKTDLAHQPTPSRWIWELTNRLGIS